MEELSALTAYRTCPPPAACGGFPALNARARQPVLVNAVIASVADRSALTLSSVLNSDDDHSDVIPASLGNRLVDELVAQTLRVLVRAQKACDLRGVDHVGEPIGTQQDPVARLQLVVDDLRRDVTPGPKSLTDGPAAQPASAGVIGGDLAQLA